MYESRAYDRPDAEGFGPDPVVVLVVTGTHDVSRFVNLLAGGVPVIEQGVLAERIRRQVRRHAGGRAALELLRQHGGPDFTEAPATKTADEPAVNAGCGGCTCCSDNCPDEHCPADSIGDAVCPCVAG